MTNHYKIEDVQRDNSKRKMIVNNITKNFYPMILYVKEKLQLY